MEVRVGPATITLHVDEQFLVCAADGTIAEDREQGYFCTDTRVVSRYAVRLARAAPTLLTSTVVEPFSARFEYTNAATATRGGQLEAGVVHLRIDRTLHRGLHEDYDLTNHSGAPIDLDLDVRVEGDYADLFDVKEHRLVRRGTLDSAWDGERRTLTTNYRNGGFERGLCLGVRRPGSEPGYANGLLSFRIRLEPQQRWHACLHWLPLGVLDQRPIERCNALREGDRALAERRRNWSERITHIATGDPGVNRVLDRAAADLAALRIHRLDADAIRHGGEGIEELVPAAGIPWFVALFGRDALTVSLQSMLLTPGLARAALQALAPTQADDTDDRHDRQPGKIEHELRRGELAHLGLVPQTPYYGTHDAPSLYVLAAAELWRWTADRGLIERLRPHVQRALSWIDSDGDRDGDGFQEYATRAGDWGYYNQSWKDSGDGIVNADGSLAELPIATCELQGYVVAAKRRWADAVEQAFDDSKAAADLRDQADRLAEAIEARLWWQAEGTYHLGLDGRKRPIESVASNAGHLLWAGAVAPDRAASVAARLLQPDMWSGWGIRTLASSHRAYNPLSYQRGSVWPHDNGLIASGLARYDLTDEAGRIARAMFDAAERFRDGRLPEVFAGLQRDAAGVPVQYLGANVPQAWAAASVTHLICALVRPEPDAARARLTLRPALPGWLGEVTLHNLRVGGAAADLRVRGGAVVVDAVRGQLQIAVGDRMPAPATGG